MDLKKRSMALGSALTIGAMPFVLHTTPAAAAEGIHRETKQFSYSVSTPTGTKTCTIVAETILDFPEDRFFSRTEIVGTTGPTDPCLDRAHLQITVTYAEDGGGQGSALAFARGGYAWLEVNDVAEPYQASSYRAVHDVWIAGNPNSNVVTSPK
jgi:hypothetical protein